MNKKFKFMTLLLYLLGFMIFSLSNIFRTRLTDFELGFCEGISIVFIVAGFIYMCWCIFKKKNPYKVENSDK
jgi:hypothetical protein